VSTLLLVECTLFQIQKLTPNSSTESLSAPYCLRSSSVLVQLGAIRQYASHYCAITRNEGRDEFSHLLTRLSPLDNSIVHTVNTATRDILWSDC
jgi:hypothetical protein